jgi:hypothetical protein
MAAFLANTPLFLFALVFSPRALFPRRDGPRVRPDLTPFAQRIRSTPCTEQ